MPTSKNPADSRATPASSKKAPLIRPRTTLRDIADAAGVSAMTVSRALHNNPRISEPVRARIQHLAKEMGYHPDPLLTALAHYRHATRETPVQAALAWLNAYPDPKQLRHYHEFDLYWKGASAAAEKVGFHLEEFIVSKAMPPSRVEKILRARNISGILVPPHGETPISWNELDWSHFSTIRFSYSTSGLPLFHAVTADQPANAALAFTKMRERGYQRIGFVGVRVKGWKTVGGFCQSQFDVPSELRLPPLLYDSQLDTRNKDRLAAWLNEHRPDAILTEVAGLPQILGSIGVRVPEDLGLAAMTTLDTDIDAGIYQNPEEIGRVAVLMLVSLINDYDRGVPPIFRQVVVSGRWVDGKTLPRRPVRFG